MTIPHKLFEIERCTYRCNNNFNKNKISMFSVVFIFSFACCTKKLPPDSRCTKISEQLFENLNKSTTYPLLNFVNPRPKDSSFLSGNLNLTL